VSESTLRARFPPTPCTTNERQTNHHASPSLFFLPSTGTRELRQLTRKRSRDEYERERPTGGWRLGSHAWWRRGPHAEGASSPGLDPVAGSGPEEEAAAGSRRPPAPRLLAWLRSRRWILRRRTQTARVTPPHPASHLLPCSVRRGKEER
jgi:hypothetical protein